ncbi:MAG: hypothetical protein ACLVJK_07090 [Alistipes putredinis]
MGTTEIVSPSGPISKEVCHRPGCPCRAEASPGQGEQQYQG